MMTTIIPSPVQFKGRILIKKDQLQPPPSTVVQPGAQEERPDDSDSITAGNLITKLGGEKVWKEGTLPFSNYQEKHFVQAQTVQSNDPKADVAAVRTLIQQGLDFIFLPTLEQNTMEAADTIATDVQFVENRVAQGKSVGYTTNSDLAAPQHILDEKA